MSNPVCTKVTLIDNNPCLSGQVFSEHQQKAVKIWFMLKELAAIGGTDYTSTVATTLISDAVALARTMNSSERRTAELAIYKNNAVAGGASISSDPDDLLASVACFINYPDLDSIVLLLLCQLGTHKAYPQ